MEDTKRFLVTTKSKKYAYFCFEPSTLNYLAIKLTENTQKIKKENENYTYTPVYWHSKYRVIGLVKDKDLKPTLYWIKEDDLKNNSLISKVMPYKHSELIEIRTEDQSIFNKLKIDKEKNRSVARYLDNESFLNIGYTRFIDRLNGKEKPITEVEKQKPAEEEQNTVEKQQAVEKAEENQPESTINIENILEAYYIKRKEREEFERQKEENNKLALKLKKLCAIATSNSMTDETLLDVQKVVTIDNKEDNNTLNTSELVYELILKALRKGDTISIPLNYFKKLKTTIRKNLFLSMSCTKYTALVDIRISDTSKDNLFALVEYDEDLEYTRITALKSYNSNKVDENDILVYEMDYNKWKKENSWIR